MDTTRKKINIDSVLSHKNGIMPYISQGDSDITFVETIGAEGDYGKFVCDFVLVSAYTYTNYDLDISVRKEVEVSRMRFLDINRKYNFVRERIRNGIILKREEYHDENVEYLNCETSESSITYIDTYRWTVNGTEILTPYHCEPLDRSLFIESDGFYFYDTLNTAEKERIERLIANGDGVTDEEIAFKESIERAEYIMENYVAIILVDDCDEIVACDEWWNGWWESGYEISTYPGSYGWEIFVFDENYRTPAHFKFVQDVEKYVLGVINVPEYYNGNKIDGVKVPQIVSYLNFYDYKDWFDTNQNVALVDADVAKEWEKRGGDAFYAFLCSVNPVFLRDTSITSGDAVYFRYEKPYACMNVNLVNEGLFEKTYRACEYKVDVFGDLEYAPSPFRTPQGVGSALTPTFIDLTETSAYVESRLTVLTDDSVVYFTDELYGIAETYGSNGASQLFECTFFSGYSSTSRLDKFYTCELYEYAKYNGEYQLVNTISIPKTFVGTIREEVAPLTRKPGVKQVVGIENLGLKNGVSAVTINESEQVVTADFEGVQLPVSAFTYITGETIYEYSWCECKPIQYNSTFKCGDGEPVDFTDLSLKKYRNITLLSVIPSYVTDKSNNTSYYFMVKYKNGNYDKSVGEPITRVRNIVTLELPYIVNKPMNITTFDGEWSGTTIYDILTEKTLSGDKMTVRYVLGATSGSDITTSGVHYVEEYEYTSGTVIGFIDGMFEAEVYVEQLKGELVSVHSDDYRADRTAKQAKIEGMEIGTQWTSGAAVNALLFTEETTESLLEYPNVKVDIIFNRGNAAAWEKHFKLSECNTLEDLENYGNGFFLS